ncbi:hypothetical protein [Granulicella arctica]|uniref:hypothetical protein n=1 Tax=Granulicella arctica TaxID=940613 RepID=UPI0021E004C2|nr:hypothetical protein [Granulicella arctica]
MSGQIDCMLVSGTGTRLPHTDLFTWQVRDVIAVFEVKKNLFSAELAGSHVHLRKVLDLHWDDFVRAPHGKVNVESAEHAFKMIVGFPPPPREQLPTLPFDIEMIYRALTVELVSPIRVALSYSGFRSEKPLRDGFIGFLKKNIGKAGMSPVMLPSLIVSGQYSLLKMNGQPYSGRQYETWWPIFASSHENPLIFVLEIIWTRLSERTEMPEWFDQDLGIEKLALLLGCRAVQQDGKSGWQYDVTEFTETQLREPGEQHTWEPHFLTVFQHTVVAHLCRHDSVGLSESLLHNLSQQEQEELEELFEVRLVGYEADRIVLLTRSCRCAILPDGRFAAADDSSGRFSAWVERYLDDRKRR